MAKGKGVKAWAVVFTANGLDLRSSLYETEKEAEDDRKSSLVPEWYEVQRVLITPIERKKRK
jgi:hypothetical protein